MLDAAKTFAKKRVIKRLLRQDAEVRAGHPLLPELWGCSVSADGQLEIDGAAVGDLVAQFGTPLHVVNDSRLIATFQDFQESFRNVYPNLILGTSYKTNPLPYVISTLHEHGSYAEVISSFELWLALELGVPVDRIIVNGPGKDDRMLQMAVQHGVQIINIDGPAEIAKIARLARQNGIRQQVGLRVTTSVGWSSQFGLSIASGAAIKAFREISSCPELIPVGLHLHLGTGIQTLDTYRQAVQEVLDFAALLDRELGVKISYFDLGGGFGVPTVRGKSDWDLRMVSLGYPPREPLPASVPKPKDFAAALAAQFEQLRGLETESGEPPTVVLEPGRAITSSGQVLLLSVIGKKQGPDGRPYIIVDGGKNITMPLEWETHKIYAATKMTDTATQSTNVFGPLCHPGDVIAKNEPLPELGEGDILAIMDAGAYFIPNQTNFSNPRPAVVSVSGGERKLVRKRERFEDIVSLDVMP